MLRALPIVIAGLRGNAPIEAAWLDLLDVVVDADAADDLLQTIDSTPIAATTLALLLRGAEGRSVYDGLVAESTAYSTLQSGSEFAGWRASRPPRPIADHDDAPRVRVERDGVTVALVLTRPDKHNALDRRMRDELVEGLLIPALDATVETVHLRGEGANFCSGGDLDEFGSRPDPALAHLVRLDRSPARLLAALSDRTVAHVHGFSIGAGMEMPAFAGHVRSSPNARFSLPEVGLGLVPGAGGTVSLPRRIGRHRTAWLALTGRSIGASTALEWGLVDELSDRR